MQFGCSLDAAEGDFSDSGNTALEFIGMRALKNKNLRRLTPLILLLVKHVTGSVEERSLATWIDTRNEM